MSRPRKVPHRETTAVLARGSPGRHREQAMSRLADRQDGYGHALYDWYLGRGGYEVNERDDGFVGVALGPLAYFAGYEAWPAHQKRAIRLAGGKVLDVGCGAGRVALHLQQKGLDVLGIDESPLAIKVCRLRGLRKARVMSITQATRKLGVFDTIVMYGNNFGLFGSFRRARWLLRRFRSITSPEGRIIAQTRDPYKTDDPDHLAYHEFNRRRGRMGGQVRFKVRYKKFATPWIDWLHASVAEMKEILDDTGWKIDKILPCESGVYVAVVGKDFKTSSLN